MTILDLSNHYPLTSRFGPRPLRGDFHWGVDYATPIGVVLNAHIDCKLVLSGKYGSEWIVVMEALDGSCNWTLGHLSETYYKPGSVVKAGTLIAKTGNSGNSTGPHLHIEYDKGRFKGSVTANHNAGTTIDPLPFLAGSGDPEMNIWPNKVTPLIAKMRKPIPMYDIQTGKHLNDSGLEIYITWVTDIIDGSTYYIPKDRADAKQVYGFREDDLFGNGKVTEEPTPAPAPEITEQQKKDMQTGQDFRELVKQL